MSASNAGLVPESPDELPLASVVLRVCGVLLVLLAIVSGGSSLRTYPTNYTFNRIQRPLPLALVKSEWLTRLAKKMYSG